MLRRLVVKANFGWTSWTFSPSTVLQSLAPRKELQMGVSKKQEPQHRPQIMGFSLRGHHDKERQFIELARRFLEEVLAEKSGRFPNWMRMHVREMCSMVNPKHRLSCMGSCDKQTANQCITDVPSPEAGASGMALD